jgi:hypothetical protein
MPAPYLDRHRRPLAPPRDYRLRPEVRFSPAENDALRYAARYLRAPIGALIRYMLLPVFQSYSSDIGAIRPPLCAARAGR